jgi:uncharacterized protein (TIGR01777 family)
MSYKTVLISGGTGMVGTALTKHLVAAGYHVTILTRNPQKAKAPAGLKDKVRFAAWDVDAQTIDLTAVAEADALVHLAGAGVVAKPWTDAYKREIRDSRVLSSQLLINAIKKAGDKLTTVVSASAIGWYGSDEDGRPPFTEDAPAAPGFLGDTCREWEASIQPVTELDKRLSILRFGIVLSNESGALPEFKKTLGLRVASVLGNGEQMISWIHIDDLCRMIQYAIENQQMQGIYNAVAPQPVTNRSFNNTLATCIYGNAFIALPVPAFILKIMMGDRSVEVLKSTTVSAAKIQQAGFTFQYPNVEKALAQLTR